MAPGPGRSGSTFPIKTTLSSSSLHKPPRTLTNNEMLKLMEMYKKSQLTGLGRDPETDTLLILADGTIPINGAILSGVSPFFAKMFDSQGQVFDTREVLMKDYSIRIMKIVVQLIYDEEVFINSEKEYEKVKSVMKSLEIFKNGRLSLSKEKSSRKGKGEEISYINETPKSNQDKDDLSSESEVEKEIESPPPPPPKKGRSNRSSSVSTEPAGSTGKKDKKSSDVDDDDFRPDDAPLPNSSSSSDSESDDSYSDKGRKNKSKSSGKRGRQQTNINNGKPKVMLPKVIVDRISIPVASSKSTTNNNNNTASNSSTTTKPTPPITITVPAKTANRTYNLGGSKDKEDGEDSELPSTEEFSDSKYEDKSWFLTKANTCQKCNTKYDGPAKASNCIANHKVLRCYYCFKLCKNTEKLFEHFKRAHKQAGRENFLMCPFCDQSVPYKSVSCHVISLHMTADGPQKKPPSSRYANVGVGRPATTLTSTVTTVNSQPPAKKTKIEEEKKPEAVELRVGNLEAVVSWIKANGKIRKFILKKDRGYTPCK